MSGFKEKITTYENNNYFKTIDLTDYHFKNGNLVSDDKNYEMSELARNMFLERVGLRCPSMLEKAFSTEKLANLSESLINALLKSESNIYAKAFVNDDNTMLALHSKNYVPLEFSSLIEVFEGSLKNEYSGVKFAKGILEEEYMAADYVISDDNVCQPYRELFGNGGEFYESHLVARLTSSNLGLSGANIYPMFCYRTSEHAKEMTIPVYGKVTLKHEGDASLEKFKDNCNYLFNLVATTPEELKKLESIKIKYPTHCLINIADKVGITAKQITPVAETVSYLLTGYNTTAKDLYVYLSTVIEKSNNDKERLEITEKVAKAIRILSKAVSEVDIPKIKWKRLNVVCDEEQDFIPEQYQEKLAV